MLSKQLPRFGHDRTGRSMFVIPQFWLACLLAMVAFPAACAQTKTVTWQEEVKLSTGEVIVVERETRFIPADTGRPKDSGWAADTMTLRFRYPPSSKEVIEWRTIRQSGPGGGNYRAPEYPLVLDVEKGTMSFILITQTNIGGCDEYYRYRYDNGAWRDDMLPEVFEKRAPNLLLGSDEINTPAQITLDFKRRFEADYHRWTRYPFQFRQIGPDRCLCGHIGNPVKSGCAQKYKSTKE